MGKSMSLPRLIPQATPSPTPTPTPTSNPNEPMTSSQRFGLLIGWVIFFILAAMLIWSIYSMCKSSSSKYEVPAITPESYYF